MQYQKLISGETIIEFHNNWQGEETVIVNGQVVSKKSSIWGTNHFFTVMEEGRNARYILTTKITDGLQVALDLSRNGELVQSDVPVQYGAKSKKPHNKAKKEGMQKLKEFELEEALSAFDKALQIAPKDPEIYFHMACAYSVLEKIPEGFECLKNAVAYNLQDRGMILTHDMLAYLRMHEAFENFLDSEFKEYEV